MSPFFLQYGYNFEPWAIPEEVQPPKDPKSPIQKADEILLKLRDSLNYAQLSMALTQERNEKYANTRRTPAPQHKVGDLVWLDMRNIRTNRPSKKLDIRSSKFKVLEQVGSHAYRLDTPPGIHNVFHTALLQPANKDTRGPFPSQKTEPHHPPGVMIDGELEYEIECILAERVKRQRREFLVKWVGYRTTTWESADNLNDTAALDNWERKEGGNVTG
jgi:hypothetical protein